MASHPEFVRAVEIFKAIRCRPVSTTALFTALMRSIFINAGCSTPVRWSMVPGSHSVEATPRRRQAGTRIISSTVSSRGSCSVRAVASDSHGWATRRPYDDATIPWPEDREHVDAGTLTLDTVEAEATSLTRDVNFDPLVLPAGIAPSDDPLLSARSAVYSESFTRRAGEKEGAERDHAFGRAKVSVRMTTEPQQFPVSMRFLHWFMAAMVLTMLGIGVAMVASLADYHRLDINPSPSGDPDS